MMSELNSCPHDNGEECQDAMESEVVALIERAQQAGWKRQQVIRALNDLAAGLWFNEQKTAGVKPAMPAVGTFPID